MLNALRKFLIRYRLKKERQKLAYFLDYLESLWFEYKKLPDEKNNFIQNK